MNEKANVHTHSMGRCVHWPFNSGQVYCHNYVADYVTWWIIH